MSIGRANEHQRAPEAPSGRAVAGARATCAGRARMSITARASAGRQMSIERVQSECEASLLSLFVLLQCPPLH